MRIELLRLLVQAITLIITAYLAPTIMSWLQEKVEDARLARIKDWALKAVKAAEQVYKDYERRDPDGTERRKMAMDVLRRANKTCRLGLTDADMEILIEAAVHEINAVGIGFFEDIVPEEESHEVLGVSGGKV